MNVSVVANQPFLHGRFDFVRGQRAELEETLARDLAARGLVTLVGKGPQANKALTPGQNKAAAPGAGKAPTKGAVK